jgi:hypothetical protein
MDSERRPVLDEEELRLRDSDPEACFQHAIQRGGLSLDRIMAPLSPRVAAAVRSIATGERFQAPGPPVGRMAPSEGTWSGGSGPLEQDDHWAATREILAEHPQLTRMLDEKMLEPSEAQEAAHALDRVLGRYMTGTRYAAP